MPKYFGSAVGIYDASPDKDDWFDKHGNDNDGRNGRNINSLCFDTAKIIKTSRIIDVGDDRTNNTEC